jgi:MFS family permease
MARTTRFPWMVVALLMALCFISHLNRVSMSVAGNARIMEEYSLTPTQMGSVYSAFLLVYTIMMIPGGLFIDRVGPRAALATMGLGSALFGALTGVVDWGLVILAQPWLSLIMVRGLMGLFTTPLHPGCARAVNDWVAVRRRRLANGLITGAALLGVASTYRIFGVLIDRVGWPSAFVVAGVCTALLTLLWMWCAGEASPDPRASSGQTTPSFASALRSLLGSRNLLLLTLSYAAIGYFQYLFFYWMQYYFEQVLHLGKASSQVYAGLPPLAMAVGMPMGGWISDRLQHSGHPRATATVPVAAFLLSAGCLGLGIIGKSPAWIVTWFSLALGLLGASEGVFWSTGVEIGRGRGGTAAAIMNTGGNAGGMLAPVVTPWISAHFGWPLGIGLGGLVCILGALCWLGIKVDSQKAT